MPLAESQLFFNRENEVTVIEAFIDDPQAVDKFRTDVETKIERPLILTDWRQRNKTFFDTLQVESNVMFIILTLIVLVAALNIVSGLTMLVKDKSSDIAILRTMGATRGSVLRIFLIIGASIGVVGDIAGFLLGLALATNLDTIRAALNKLMHANLFPAELYFLSRLPSIVDPREVTLVVTMTLVARHSRLHLSRLEGGEPRSDRRAAPRVTMASPVLELSGVARHYREGATRLDILTRRRSRALARRDGGAGRAVRRRQIDTCCTSPACWSSADAGEVYVDGRATSRMSDNERTALRRTTIGFVYQFHHLLPEFTALENVVLPQTIGGLDRREAEQPRARAARLSAASAARAPSAVGALGRRAAARRHRPRRRQCAACAARRRADRQSRSRAPRSMCSRR